MKTKTKKNKLEKLFKNVDQSFLHLGLSPTAKYQDGQSTRMKRCLIFSWIITVRMIQLLLYVTGIVIALKRIYVSTVQGNERLTVEFLDLIVYFGSFIYVSCGLTQIVLLLMKSKEITKYLLKIAEFDCTYERITEAKIKYIRAKYVNIFHRIGLILGVLITVLNIHFLYKLRNSSDEAHFDNLLAAKPLFLIDEILKLFVFLQWYVLCNTLKILAERFRKGFMGNLRSGFSKTEEMVIYEGLWSKLAGIVADLKGVFGSIYLLYLIQESSVVFANSSVIALLVVRTPEINPIIQGKPTTNDYFLYYEPFMIAYAVFRVWNFAAIAHQVQKELSDLLKENILSAISDMDLQNNENVKQLKRFVRRIDSTRTYVTLKMGIKVDKSLFNNFIMKWIGFQFAVFMFKDSVDLQDYRKAFQCIINWYSNSTANTTKEIEELNNSYNMFFNNKSNKTCLKNITDNLLQNWSVNYSSKEIEYYKTLHNGLQNHCSKEGAVK